MSSSKTPRHLSSPKLWNNFEFHVLFLFYVEQINKGISKYVLAIPQTSQLWYTVQFLFQSLKGPISTMQDDMFPRVHLHFVPGRFPVYETVYINAIYVYICIYRFLSIKRVWWLTAFWWSQTVLFPSGKAQQFIMFFSSLT